MFAQTSISYFWQLFVLRTVKALHACIERFNLDNTDPECRSRLRDCIIIHILNVIYFHNSHHITQSVLQINCNKSTQEHGESRPAPESGSGLGIWNRMIYQI